MRQAGVPAEAVQENQPDNTSSNAGDTSLSRATKRPLDSSNSRSSSDSGSRLVPIAVVNLKTAIVELARRNEERQGGVESAREGTGVAEHAEIDEELQNVDEEIAVLEEQLAQAKTLREGLQKRANRKATAAKQKLLIPQRALETERTVLDRVYDELQRTPSDHVCARVRRQIDALQRAPRDRYGAVAEVLSGPYVSARPELESTDEAVLAILDETLLVTESRPKVHPRKRRKRAEPI